MDLSFSIKEASWKKGIIIVLCVTLGILSPLLFGLWWVHLGGSEYYMKKELQSLSKRDPVQEAEKAIQNNDLRLYKTGEVMDTFIPGYNRPSSKYNDHFGYKFLSIYTHDPLTEEEQQLNQTALQFMAIYNAIIFTHVNTNFPDWRNGK